METIPLSIDVTLAKNTSSRAHIDHWNEDPLRASVCDDEVFCFMTMDEPSWTCIFFGRLFSALDKPVT